MTERSAAKPEFVYSETALDILWERTRLDEEAITLAVCEAGARQRLVTRGFRGVEYLDPGPACAPSEPMRNELSPIDRFFWDDVLVALGGTSQVLIGSEERLSAHASLQHGEIELSFSAEGLEYATFRARRTTYTGVRFDLAGIEALAFELSRPRLSRDDRIVQIAGRARPERDPRRWDSSEVEALWRALHIERCVPQAAALEVMQRESGWKKDALLEQFKGSWVRGRRKDAEKKSL